MKRLADLSIRTKFFGLMSLLLLALLVVAGTFTYQREKAFILHFAVDNARGFARQLIETRDYISSVVKNEPAHNYALVPQVVATRVAKRVTQNSKFYVRQVSLRYRNPQNRPDPFEAARLQAFNGNPGGEIYGIVGSGANSTFRYMLPMLATASCLECHGSYHRAPEFIKKRFPQGHFSYNYQIGQVIGAVSVSIPMKDLYAQLGVDLQLDILARGIVFVVLILVMAILMSRQIIEPVKLVSERITRVAHTGDFHVKLPQQSHDEIGTLIGAFNELMDELSRKTLQSLEADERYRRFIELTGSAVVTFLKDGKMVIANRKAESLFGRNQQALLGESIFRFLEDSDALRQWIAAGLGTKEESFMLKVRGASGRVTDVDMVISASQTDREPMYTAILSERS